MNDLVTRGVFDAQVQFEVLCKEERFFFFDTLHISCISPSMGEIAVLFSNI